MLVIFVKVDGEDLSRKAFRCAENGINSEGREKKIKEVIKIRIKIYLKEILQRKL